MRLPRSGRGAAALVIACGVWCAALAQNQSPPKDPTALMRSARQAMADGKFREAADQAEQAQLLAPHDLLPYAIAAQAWEHDLQFDRALANLAKAEQIDSSPGEKDDLKALRREIETRKQAAALATEGNQALQNNQFARAATALTAAWRLWPELTPAAFEAAKAWWRIEEYGRAVELLHQLAKDSDRKVRTEATDQLAQGAQVIAQRYAAALDAGNLAFSRGDMKQAEIAARDAALFGDDKPEPQLLLCKILIRTDRKQDAVRAVEQAVRLGYVDRAGLTKGDFLRPLFGLQDYQTLVGNVFGPSAALSVAAQDGLAGLDGLPTLDQKAARMAALRTQYPGDESVAQADAALQARIQAFRGSLASAQLITDPARRVEMLRRLAAEWPNESSIGPALAAATIAAAAAKERADREEAERRAKEALRQEQLNCEKSRMVWRFAVHNTTDIDIGFTLNGEARSLPSGTHTDIDYGSGGVWSPGSCTVAVPPVLAFTPNRKGATSASQQVFPLTDHQYQFIDDKGVIQLLGVEPTQPLRLFGVVARDRTSDRLVGFMNATSWHQAAQAVAQQCGPSCDVVKVFWDSCVAVYSGRQYDGSITWNYARRADKPAAVDAATTACNDQGLTDCTIRTQFCANNP